VRDQLLDLQAEAVGLPVRRVNIPSPCPNDVYEAAMAEAVAEAWDQGITHMAFGDLFLADIRAYREERLQESGLTPLFPLWGRETGALARRMIAAGIRAILTCVDPSQLDRRHAGSSFDALLAELPAGCDPCGERGEFHTFAWDGPGFSHPVPVSVGEVVERDGFVFADLLPA
jgi:diphthamide synthase (EF-2-diphthine--ammonia ligase)